MKVLLAIVLFLNVFAYGFLLYQAMNGKKVFKKSYIEGIAHVILATTILLLAVVVRYM